MLNAAIVCARAYLAYGPPECPDPVIQLDLTRESVTPGDVHDALAAHGWVRVDGEDYCPRHHPDDAGTRFHPPIADGAYHPIAESGWEARGFQNSNELEVRPIRRPGEHGAELDAFTRARLTTLLELASAASPGPWRTGTHVHRNLYHSGTAGVAKSGVYFGVVDRAQDAEYITALDPDTVQAIVTAQVALLDYAFGLPEHIGSELRAILARPHREATGFKDEWNADA